MYHVSDILFSSQGKIKRIKIYASSDGTKKGDALVTYTRPEFVPLACRQVIQELKWFAARALSVAAVAPANSLLMMWLELYCHTVAFFLVSLRTLSLYLLTHSDQLQSSMYSYYLNILPRLLMNFGNWDGCYRIVR